ncbi:MAG TPA: hypothetical protein VJV78_44670 [Polyangiales bacterium]|nr:hypothetical protein [Polyangiales bacterium]
MSKGRTLRSLASWLLAAMGGALVGPAAAIAQSEVPLTWNAPAGCPPASDVLPRVRAQLAERQLSEQTWSGAANVQRKATGFRLELSLEVRGAAAQRIVDAASCETLVDTAGVLIVLALLDAQRIEAPPPSATAPPASTDSQPTAAANNPPSSAPRKAPVPTPSSEPPSTGLPERDTGPAPVFSFGVGASVRLDVGTLPAEPAFGLAPRLLVKFGRLSATAGVTFWLAAQRTVDGYPAARLEGRGVLGDFALGFELTREPISFAPCLAIEHGQLRVRSLGIQTPDSAHYLWTAAGGGARAAVGLGAGLYAGLELLALIPWSRQGFLLRTPSGDVPIFRAAPLALRISAEFAYVFE